ncbi:MAG: hypothetical protein E7478_05025, partial [Ruminococcaceae bacterium]|nr:hypothetical protein [Oscillospiraceae bacterium]
SPRFEWTIDAVRVMNTVRLEEISYCGREDDSAELYCCLRDVRYQVRARLVRAQRISEYGGIPEAYSIAQRSLKRGGRRMTYLGKREFGCDIKPCVFGEGFCCYQGTSLDMGMMFHSIIQRGGEPYARIFRCRMEDGIIRFPPPSECIVTRIIEEDLSDALA